MKAQQKAPFARRQSNRPVATRLRMGLVMRKGMDFGAMGDVETALRMQGVSLAPISTGEASLNINGVMVMATATAEDIASGRVRGLVVPGGARDEAGEAMARALVQQARDKGLPVIGFGEGVALGAAVAGQNVEGEGAVFSSEGVTSIHDKADLGRIVDQIAA